jgi:copine 5/8/9
VNNDAVKGVAGIVNIYGNAFEKLQLSGPTHFAEIIRAAREIAVKPSQTLTYSILLIITDGVVNDRKQTIDEIVKASTTPLSIIIIGVGDADFSDMEMLDADNEPLVSNGVKQEVS